MTRRSPVGSPLATPCRKISEMAPPARSDAGRKLADGSEQPQPPGPGSFIPVPAVWAASAATGPRAPGARGVRHPDGDDDVRPSVEHRAIVLAPLVGAYRPVPRALLEKPGAGRAVGAWVEVGFAVGQRDRLVRCSGAVPSASGAFDELFDVPRPRSLVVIADADGDDLRITGHRRGGRRQQRGAREHRDDRAAHRVSSVMCGCHPATDRAGGRVRAVLERSCRAGSR
jgi:hypothetical protein